MQRGGGAMTLWRGLLPLLLIGLVTPAPAQTLGLPSLSIEDETSSSEALSHMSTPPSLEAAAPEEMPAAPSLSSAEALKLFADSCAAAASGTSEGIATTATLGWLPYDSEDTGPYKAVFAASQEVPGFGSVELWSSVETYPTRRLGYCRVDFGDYDNALDFGFMAGLGLSGTEAAGDGGNVRGAWESADHTVLVIADRTDGETAIEFNILIGPAPAQN